jgi:peptidoglycan-N-acetylglucosamine deacetylase
MKDIHSGDIILFHNNGIHTAQALNIILERIAKQDLRAVAISELLLKGDTYIDIDGIQKLK